MSRTRTENRGARAELPLEERELATLAKHTCQPAAAELMRVLENVTRSKVRRGWLASQDVDDVVQSALLRILEHGKNGGTFYGNRFVLGILRNVSIDFMRRYRIDAGLPGRNAAKDDSK
jgi:DNA-directed RNA polymerase specialized sigma24 family protein